MDGCCSTVARSRTRRSTRWARRCEQHGEREGDRGFRAALEDLPGDPGRPSRLVRAAGVKRAVRARGCRSHDLRRRRERLPLTEASLPRVSRGLRDGGATRAPRPRVRHCSPRRRRGAPPRSRRHLPSGEDARTVTPERALRADAAFLRVAWVRRARGAPRPLERRQPDAHPRQAPHMPITVGTAGHVDHGKTWLVRALTGKDTDRLPEERRRGMSIDLGYAPLELPGGRRASLIDVPGHERFVRAMVAGATGIDLFLLVVDAAEGARPQTHEHLAILRLLGIDRGVVAVTKADAVGGEQLAAVVTAAAELVPQAEVVAASAKTGSGVDELRGALMRAADAVEERTSEGATRLFVDRAFSLRGIGTVATGTLWSGSVAAGEVLTAEPGGRRVRVRSVQVH